MKIFSLYFAILLIFTSCKSTKTVSAELSKEELAILGKQFQEMHSIRLLQLEKGNVDKAVQCFADDAYLMDIGALAKGKDSIRHHLETVLMSMSLNETNNVQEGVEISGNIGYDYGSTTMRLDFEFTGQSINVRSKYVSIWKKLKSGKWKISKLIFNQN